MELESPISLPFCLCLFVCLSVCLSSRHSRQDSQSNLEAHTVDQCVPGDILALFQFIVISITPNTIPCVEFKSQLLCVLDLSADTVLHLDALGFPIVFGEGSWTRESLEIVTF